MKRHTYKNKNILGILLILTMVALGIGIGMHNTSAADKNSTTEVKFTFQDSLSMKVPTTSGWTGNNHETNLAVEPGESNTGDVAGPVEISSNAGGGFYVSATVGTKGGDGNLNLTTGVDASNKFTILGTSANVSDLSAQDGSVWGIRYAVDSADINKQTYNGFPLDDSDDGASGTKIIEADGPGQKSFKYQVGAKADKTLTAGTYQNTIHFYAVTK